MGKTLTDIHLWGEGPENFTLREYTFTTGTSYMFAHRVYTRGDVYVKRLYKPDRDFYILGGNIKADSLGFYTPGEVVEALKSKFEKGAQ